jgi:hypothetical protein
MLLLAGVFLVGMIVGSIFTSRQPVQTASTDGKTALAFLLNDAGANLGKRETQKSKRRRSGALRALSFHHRATIASRHTLHIP